MIVFLFLTHGISKEISSLYRQGYEEVPLRSQPPGFPHDLLGFLVSSTFGPHPRAGACPEGSMSCCSHTPRVRGNSPSFVPLLIIGNETEILTGILKSVDLKCFSEKWKAWGLPEVMCGCRVSCRAQHSLHSETLLAFQSQGRHPDGY